MNWISFAEQRPNSEPLREILVRLETGDYRVTLSTLPTRMTHWAEIEPPKPDPFEEAWCQINTANPEENDYEKARAMLVWDAAIKWKEDK